MLTRKRWVAPGYTGNGQTDYANLVKSISDYLLSLEGKNALTISQNQIYVDQGLQFPATQVASTDANNLDDYKEGSTTPTPTANAGVFTSVSASVKYTKIGNRCFVTATVVITTNGTAGGYVIVPMPYTAAEATAVGGGRDDGVGLSASFSGSNLLIAKYDGTYPGADGRTLVVGASFRV